MSWVDTAYEQYTLRAGYYRLRRPPEYEGEHWSKRDWLPVVVWYGPPHDPLTGLELDRAPRWQALFGCKPVEINEVIPWCLKHPITEEEYEKMTETEDE